MRVSDRLDAIDKIGRELQSRYSYDEIDIYLAQFNVAPPKDVSVNSKWVYSKAALSTVGLETIARIADDLGIGSLEQIAAQGNPPAIWKGTNDLRLFVSHISKDKDKATRLRDCLKKFAIQAFVAHEDIEPTRNWQTEIERALFSMDAFVAIHTPGFATSIWTQQEIGFALGRGIKTISLRMGEDPTGFISKHQALSRGKRAAEEVARELARIFEADERTAKRLREAQEARAAEEVPF